jgi:crotonobetainyl-CoA:carnitine CoA-transferase CaiB-like acyl-CoA transferase
MVKKPDLVREDLLTGVRVVELGEAVVGPWAGLLLADLGAQVIKVESINRTDLSRGPISIKGPVPFFEDYPDGKLGERPWNRTARYNTYNIGKFGITLDLAKQPGVQAFLKIVQVSDVLLTNMALGVAEKMGLSYQEVCAVNPNIIYLSATGFGRKGPYAKRMTMGNVIDGASGMFGLRDYGDGDSTAVTPSIHCDTTAASTNAFAILAALYHRKKTGRGLFIDVSMVESSMSHIGEAIMDYTLNQRVKHSLGNRDTSMSPQGCYRCQGGDEWVTLSIADDREWKRLAELMGSPGLAEDERFADVLGRIKNHDDLDGLIEAWTEWHSKFEVMQRLQEKGIASGAVYNNADVYKDPHFQAREVLEEIDHPEAGRRSYVRRLWQLEDTPETKRRHAPLLGQHTEFVLETIAGLTPEEIQELKRDGIIGTEPTR